MPQRSLHHYFISSSKTALPSGRSFLDLPYAVRYRIYVLAGLVRSCPIDLNLEGVNTAKHRQEVLDGACFYYSKRFYGKYLGIDEVADCICPRLPYQLLYVSRAVHGEVQSILYSENRFRISRSNQWHLKPLRNLSPKALASLTSLTIRLNACSCIFAHDCTAPPRDCMCHPLCNRQNLHDKPLGHLARQDKSVISEWNNIIVRMAAHIHPPSLTLSVICDTRDHETAQLIAEPLLQLQPLKDVALRVGREPSWELQGLATRMTHRLMGRSPNCAKDSTTPRFTSLPEEIQEQILEYTNLVAPFDLEWRPDKGLVPFDCCRKCTDTLEVCCCSHYHAAFSSKCTCWRMPISIFLISRRVHELAIHTFYSQNHFVVVPHGGRRPRDIRTSTPARAEISEFLSQLPSYAWKHLRSIQWTLPTFYPNYFLPGEKGTLDWLDTVDLIARRCDLSKLRIHIDMASQLRSNDDAYMARVPHHEMAMWHAYQRIVEPIVRLKGLNDLFVYLSWPLSSEPGGLRNQHEQILERLVMGDAYDSGARGKFATRRLWNDGWSEEGPIYGPNGSQEWPPVWWDTQDSY